MERKGLIYVIPVFIREIKTGSENLRRSCEMLDNVGFFLYYDEKKPAPEEIRKFLHFRVGKRCFVGAESPQEAIDILLVEWEGANVGGKSEKSKALWINRDLPILELPFCPRLRKNKSGEYTCGEEEEKRKNEQGEWGMCYLEVYDPPDDCPVADFFGVFSETQDSEFEKFMHNGREYPFFRARF